MLRSLLGLSVPDRPMPLEWLPSFRAHFVCVLVVGLMLAAAADLTGVVPATTPRCAGATIYTPRPSVQRRQWLCTNWLSQRCRCSIPSCCSRSRFDPSQCRDHLALLGSEAIAAMHLAHRPKPMNVVRNWTSTVSGLHIPLSQHVTGAVSLPLQLKDTVLALGLLFGEDTSSTAAVYRSLMKFVKDQQQLKELAAEQAQVVLEEAAEIHSSWHTVDGTEYGLFCIDGFGLAAITYHDHWPQATAYARAFALKMTPIGAHRLAVAVRELFCSVPLRHHNSTKPGMCNSGTSSGILMPLWNLIDEGALDYSLGDAVLQMLLADSLAHSNAIRALARPDGWGHTAAAMHTQPESVMDQMQSWFGRRRSEPLVVPMQVADAASGQRHKTAMLRFYNDSNPTSIAAAFCSK